MILRSFYSCLSALVFSAPLGVLAEEFTLVQSGEPQAVVVISSKEEREKFSPRGNTDIEKTALEFIDTVEKITGAKLPLVRLDPLQASKQTKDSLRYDGKKPIYIGEIAASKAGLQEALEDHSGFVIHSTRDSLAIAGASPRSTEIGVHALLEEFGVRWFFPGELGTVIPKVSTLTLGAGQRSERPSFEARHFAQIRNADEWVRHQRTGGPYFPGAHTLKLGKEVTFESHPHLYALVKGERRPPQLCVSHPDTLRLAVEYARGYFRERADMPWLGMGPADASGYCKCEGCVALDGGDWDPFSNDISVTDRYVWFFNTILKELEDEFPDRKVAFYIYHNYLRPPVKTKPHRNLVGALAPIALCRVHGMNNPICPEKGYLRELVTKWTEILPEVYERSYWFNLADPGMLFIQLHRLKDEIQWYASRGIKGFRTEVTGQWASHGPSLWVAGKLMWDANSDVDALLADFCKHLFGPAAAPMQRYFSLLDQVLETGDHHSGSAFDLLRFYPSEVRRKAEAELTEAQSLAPGSPYRERLAIFADGYRFTDAFARMIESRDRGEWIEAYQALGEMDQISARLRGMTPPLAAGQMENYLRRFFRLPIEQGFARASGEHRLVAPLMDEWEMLIDPLGVGESLSYFSPEIKGGNWQKVRTFSTTWSEEGLRYYKGLAWYRQEVEVKAEAVGQRMFLWFGGVDESARVWVNGQLVGTSPSSAFTPFEVDVTEAVVSGKNLITLCVANLRVDELGTGGITAPGFLYLPADGAGAQLENVKPLRNTFP